MSIESEIKNYAAYFEERLKAGFSNQRGAYKTVADAMLYGIADGGKRIRPFLINRFYKLAGGKSQDSFNFELAIESIHSYSLIHDDLPSMDNDDMRRGKPSCHKKFGEANALLAGDALLTYAFFTASRTENIPSDRVLKGIEILSDLAGIDGMVGGQAVDLESENKSVGLDTVELICRLKTGALIKAACLIGALLGGADSQKLKAAQTYAENLGLAFQIVDDILDAVGDEKKLGKPTGSDEENKKSTFLSILGINKCQEMAEKLTNNAKAALEIFGEDAEPLKELADFLCSREY